MIIRAVIGMVLGGALAIGALFGASMYLGLKPVTRGVDVAQPETGPADIEPSEAEAEGVEGGEEAFEGEPHIPMPYDDGDPAGWLSQVLAGTGPYDLDAMDGPASVDLAAVADAAAGEQPDIPAQPQAGDQITVHGAYCGSSHVMIGCYLERITTRWREDAGEDGLTRFEDGDRYSFGMYQDETGVWRVAPDTLRHSERG